MMSTRVGGARAGNVCRRRAAPLERPRRTARDGQVFFWIGDPNGGEYPRSSRPPTVLQRASLIVPGPRRCDRATLVPHGMPCSECRTPLRRATSCTASPAARAFAAWSPGLTARRGTMGGNDPLLSERLITSSYLPPPSPCRIRPPLRPSLLLLLSFFRARSCAVAARRVLIGRAEPIPHPRVGRTASPSGGNFTVGGACRAGPNVERATAEPPNGPRTATASADPAKGKAKKDSKAIETSRAATGETYSKSLQAPKTLTTPASRPPYYKPPAAGSESGYLK